MLLERARHIVIGSEKDIRTVHLLTSWPSCAPVCMDTHLGADVLFLWAREGLRPTSGQVSKSRSFLALATGLPIERRALSGTTLRSLSLTWLSRDWIILKTLILFPSGDVRGAP